MIRIANVNMETYAKSARAIFTAHRDDFLDDAVRNIAHGVPAQIVSDKIRSKLQRELFQKIQRERIVTVYTNWQCNSQTGIFRRRKRLLQMSDVPTKFLDVQSLIPDFDSQINEMVLQAKGLVLAGKIEKIAEDCRDKELGL